MRSYLIIATYLNSIWKFQHLIAKMLKRLSAQLTVTIFLIDKYLPILRSEAPKVTKLRSKKKKKKSLYTLDLYLMGYETDVVRN